MLRPTAKEIEKSEKSRLILCAAFPNLKRVIENRNSNHLRRIRLRGGSRLESVWRLADWHTKLRSETLLLLRASAAELSLCGRS